ncbi:MAG: AAA family ATPase [Candidatus Limnocylindrales bacterium]
MTVCAACGQENPDQARFCFACGATMAGDAPIGRRVRKVVTIVFCDVAGSTELGERLDPETLRTVMGRYFEVARRTLERHGGTVEKFIGDAVMAVFGIPVLHEDDALRALRGADDLRSAVVRLGRDLEADLGIGLTVRIGIATGEVVAEGATRAESFATGEAVNVAARLEQAAEPGEILVDEATVDLARDAIDATVLAPLALRGKSTPVTAFRLEQVRADAPGRIRHFDAPLVGRDRERRLLREAFDRALADGAGQLFTILGSAGVGKSRLVREVLSELAAEARVARGRCLPYGEGITYWPVAELVRDLAGITDADGQAEAVARLVGLVQGGDAEREVIVAPVAGAIGLGPQASREAIARGLRRLLEQLAQRQPLVVVFDDVHWGEAVFLDLVEELVDGAREAPILVICMARPELLEQRPTWSGGKMNATTILLEPLAGDDCDGLVAGLLGASAPEALLQRVREASEGNPLFVEELVAMLTEDGVVRRGPTGWEIVGDIDRHSVPPSISALIAARLDRLGTGERTTIERASVAGRVFWRGALDELSPDADVDAVAGYLMTLVRKELIRPDRSSFVADDAYRFRHLLVRDAAYQSLPKEARAELHERFAAWLERVVGERVVEYEEIIGYHLEQAHGYRHELQPTDPRLSDLAARAAARLASAGRRAFARSDLGAAANLLGRAAALGMPDPIAQQRLVIDLTDVYAEAGRFAEAQAALDRAERLAEDAADEVGRHLTRVQRSALGMLITPHDWTDQAMAIADEAIPVFERSGDDHALARAWALRGSVHTMLALGTAMADASERARAYAQLAGDDRMASQAAVWVAVALWLGPMPVAEALGRCREMLAGPGLDPLSESGVRSLTAGLLAMLGDFEAARAEVKASARITAELGPTVRGAAFSQAHGLVEMLAGDPVRAEQLLRAGYEILDHMGERSFLSTTAGLLAQVLFDQGRFEEAIHLADVCRDAASADDLFSQVLWRIGHANAGAANGDFAAAISLTTEAVKMADASDFAWIQGHAHMALGGQLQLAGRPAGAASEYRLAIDLFERKGVVPSVQQARGLLAALPDPSSSARV